jgi:hypothetical protein
MTAHTFLIEPFDIGMHASEDGIHMLQARFSTWSRTLREPARFLCWQMPTTLDDKIAALNAIALATDDGQRRALLVEYRRYYESLNADADYQRALCGMALWSDQNARALGAGMASAFDTFVQAGDFPALFVGDYALRERPFWHLAPTGRPGGRPLWAILTSYDFQPAQWTFGRPLAPLLRLNYPLALAVDMPKTYERNGAIDAIEGVIQAYQVHLAGMSGEDSRSVQRIADCRRALAEINAGDALHLVQIAIAVAADDLKTLRERVQTIVNETRAWFSLRQEEGELLSRAVLLFTARTTKAVGLPDTTWPVTSRELALLFAPLGQRKLAGTDGILRGEAVGGAYPVFHNSWQDKRATHEVWVGTSGYGKVRRMAA